MTELKQLMLENRWNAMALAEKFGCSRYLLSELLRHPPETNIQREMTEKICAFLRGKSTASLDSESSGIPLFGEIPAGPLMHVDGSAVPESFIPCSDLDPQRHFALRVRGSSMEPEFKNGDIVIAQRVEGVALPTLDEGPTPLHQFIRFEGRVVCALIDGEGTTLKKLHITRTGTTATQYVLTLKPLNENHPPIVIGPDNTFAIQGEAVRLLRDL